MLRTDDEPAASRARPAGAALRPIAAGKFLIAGGARLQIRGVTYGTFRPGPDGEPYPAPDQVEADFAAMAASGFNAVRTYTVPPRFVLDRAHAHGLRILVGLAWEEHVAFLEHRRQARDIERRVRRAVRACAGHPAVLAYAIGNEIPAPIVRWHGADAVEAFLARLADATREEDPGALVTYVNYPSTEFLELPFVDLCCFNVYLESQERLTAYLARLQNLAGDRPLVLAEIGLDSRRNGLTRQAEVLDWQVRTALRAGCAGTFVFAWTDEWHRGGHDIEDWDFGLTDRARRPKPALSAVQRAMTDGGGGLPRWPRVSVVVCTYNGSRTIRGCLDGLMRLDYPDYEVIVVDDGSTDATAAIARGYPVRLISGPNRGLGSARNTGLHAATGEIVAYIDDDASPDPEWLRHLVTTFLETPHACVGGPNIPPPGDGWIAECVANAPGGPIHVLIDDRLAEHVPGCNMAFRKVCLEAIGGFDPQFRTAGDDVDVCWRLQERGWTIGFNPAAMVWHHRRNSVRAYWRQQKGYGRAEALLERKFPERYNAAGHVTWQGRLYGRGFLQRLGAGRGRIYQGSWGTALFQSVYEPAAGLLSAIPMMPEWHLFVLGLAALATLGFAWPPLMLAWPALALAVAAPVGQAVLGARRAILSPRHTPLERWRARALVFALHLAQPLARLQGRLVHGLTPWRRRGRWHFALPRHRAFHIWSERWQAPVERLRAVEARLRARGCAVLRGGDFDRWDLEARPGALGGARLLAATEEHGAGRQLTRFRVWPGCSLPATITIAVLLGLAAWATAEGARLAALALAGTGIVIGTRMIWECGAAVESLRRAAEALGQQEVAGALVQRHGSRERESAPAA